MVLKKIHHLIRYFFLFGIITFAGYTKNLQHEVFLFFAGPCLFIAYTLYAFLTSEITFFPKTDAVKYFGFLLPICFLYYGFIGFQLKQLWNERGIMRWIILIIFIVFILYIHIAAFQKLSGFLSTDL